MFISLIIPNFVKTASICKIMIKKFVHQTALDAQRLHRSFTRKESTKGKGKERERWEVGKEAGPQNLFTLKRKKGTLKLFQYRTLFAQFKKGQNLTAKSEVFPFSEFPC